MKTKLFKSAALIAGFVALTACPGKNNNNNNNTNVPQGRISSLGTAGGSNATCDINNGSFTCNAIDQMGRSCLSRAVTYNVNDNSNFCAQVQQLRQEQAMGSAMQCNVISALDQVLNQRCGIPINPNGGNGGNGGNNGGLGGNPLDPNGGGQAALDFKNFSCQLVVSRGGQIKFNQTGSVSIIDSGVPQSFTLKDSRVIKFLSSTNLDKVAMTYKPASNGGTDKLEIAIGGGFKLSKNRKVYAMSEGFAGGMVSLKVNYGASTSVLVRCKSENSQFKNTQPTAGNLLCKGGAKTANSDREIDEIISPSLLGQNREVPLTPDVTIKQVNSELVSMTVLDEETGLSVETSASAQGPVKSESYTSGRYEDASISCFRR